MNSAKHGTLGIIYRGDFSGNVELHIPGVDTMPSVDDKGRAVVLIDGEDFLGLMMMLVGDHIASALIETLENALGGNIKRPSSISKHCAKCGTPIGGTIDYRQRPR